MVIPRPPARKNPMPITAQRLHALLIEHEDTLERAKALHNVILGIIKGPQEIEEQLSAESKLDDIKATVSVLLKLPHHVHLLERTMYNRNAKRNARAKIKQAHKREMLGTSKRQAPGSPDQLEAQVLEELDYAQATTYIPLKHVPK
jgi:hypothetical protein